MLFNLRGNCGEGLTTAARNKAEIIAAQREPDIALISAKWLQPLTGSTGYISWPNQAVISAQWINQLLLFVLDLTKRW